MNVSKRMATGKRCVSCFGSYLEEVDIAYSSIEPFLDKPTREAVTSKLYILRSIATMIDGKQEIPGQMRFGRLQDEFHEILVPALFDRQ